MTKEKEVTLEIRQAESADAALVIDFLNKVGKESDYMTLDETGIGMTP
ncbi:MAG: GNAT family N-acetyltransferase, partial [Streptococcus sp.]